MFSEQYGLYKHVLTVHRQVLTTPPAQGIKLPDRDSIEVKPWRQPCSLIVVATAINAALYAVGSFTTAFIPSPWRIGQFRPAVVIPAFFSVIFGPGFEGIGAEICTLIADSVKHGGIYPGSLLANWYRPGIVAPITSKTR